MLLLSARSPVGWEGFEVAVKHGRGTYHIVVRNSGDFPQVWLDGEALASPSIPLVDDGRVHEVVVGLVEEDPKGFRNPWGLLGVT